MLEYNKITKKTLTISFFLISALFLSFLIYFVINFVLPEKKITTQDFEDNPNVYSSKILENFKKLDSAKTTSILNLNSQNQNSSFEAVQFFDNKSRKQIIFFTINHRENAEFIDTKGVFYRDKSRSYLIFNHIASTDTLIRSIKIDQWYEIDMQAKTPSFWLNFLMSEISKNNLKKLWQALGQVNIFDIKSKKTDHPEKIFLDLNINSKNFNKSKNKISSFLRAYNKDSREIAKGVSLEENNNPGKMIIDKKDFILESINLASTGKYKNESINTGFDLKVEKDQNFPIEIKPESPISLSEFVKNSDAWKSIPWYRKLLNF